MQFLTEHIATIVGYLFGGGSLYALYVERKKRKAEVESMEIGNEERIIEIYQKSLDDLEARMDKKHNENSAKIDELEKENEELKKKLQEVEDYWKKKYQELKRNFEKYKREHP